MTRIESILKAIRFSLSDLADQQRWTDERLLLLIDEAHRDVAVKTHVLKGTASIYPLEGVAEYALPEECWLITRATYVDRRLLLKSFDDMDDNSLLDDTAAAWETETGQTPLALITDNRDMSVIRVYPIPNEESQKTLYSIDGGATLDFVVYLTDSPYGEITSVSEFETVSNDFGFVTSCDSVFYTNSTTEVNAPVAFSSPYGLVASIQDDIALLEDGQADFGIVSDIEGHQFNSVFGVISDVFSTDIQNELIDTFGFEQSIYLVEVPITVRYIKAPAAISTIYDSLLTHPMFDVAIQQYVIGSAYRDDHDAKSAQKASDAFAFYERALTDVKLSSQRDGMKAPVIKSKYRTGFE